MLLAIFHSHHSFVGILPSVIYCLTLIDVDPFMHVGSFIP